MKILVYGKVKVCISFVGFLGIRNKVGQTEKELRYFGGYKAIALIARVHHV